MGYCLQHWVSWSFLQYNNHQAVKKMECIENGKYEKLQTKHHKDFVYVWLYVCECEWVYAYACMGYSFVWIRVFMRLS